MLIKVLYLLAISLFYFVLSIFFVPFSFLNLTILLVIFIVVQFSFYAWNFYDFYIPWKLVDFLIPIALDLTLFFIFYLFLSKMLLLEINIFLYFSLFYLFSDVFLRVLFKSCSYTFPKKKLVFLVESHYSLDFINNFISYQNRWNIIAIFRYKDNHFPPSYKEIIWNNWEEIAIFLKQQGVNLFVYEVPLNIEDLSFLNIPFDISENINSLSLVNFIVNVEKKVPLFLVDSFWIRKFIPSKDFAFRSFLKRGFDIIFSLVLLPILLPLILITAILTLITSRGPIFYSQIREGFKGKPFRIYKFRSMKVDAEAEGVQWAKKSDTRITFWGKIMRKLRLDELPQIWNVIKGDMSFVGPRPERPEFTQILREKIPFYDLRNNVKPGLTGWAQINYPYGASIEDSWKKTEYDLFYVHNPSLWQDIKILIKTAQVVIMGKGQ